MSDDRVINILFHGVGTPQRELEPDEEHYWVSEDRFRRILDELAAISRVRISFDDGNRSDVEIALPALLERRLRADFFVLAGRLGVNGSLDEDAVRELVRQGMHIGSHGMRHRPWSQLDRHTRHDELVTARERISAIVGADVDTAACPFGRYNRRALTDLRRLGYRRVFTSDRRPARPNAWLQARYSVRATDTVATVRQMVFGPRPLPQRARASAAGLVKRWL
jgi:peptidoglycan/xylan/chitin deacetylase (PgdA/CDA1 family)